MGGVIPIALAKLSSLEIVGLVILGAVVLALEILFFYYLGRAILSLYRKYEQAAQKAVAACFVGMNPRDTPLLGDVNISYHTYHGVLVWFTQTHHRLFLPSGEARCLLKRLLRFNLVWGCTSYGALFVPFLAVTHYLGQQRSIDRQLLDGKNGLNE